MKTLHFEASSKLRHLVAAPATARLPQVRVRAKVRVKERVRVSCVLSGLLLTHPKEAPAAPAPTAPTRGAAVVCFLAWPGQLLGPSGPRKLRREVFLRCDCGTQQHVVLIASQQYNALPHT